MELRTPPSSARRNPPRRAKLAAAASVSASALKNRPQSSKKLHSSEQHSLPSLLESPPFLFTAKTVSNPTEENGANVSHSTELAEEEASQLPRKREAEEASDIIEVLAAIEENPSENNIHSHPSTNTNPGLKNLQIFLRIRPAKFNAVRRSVIGIPKASRQKLKTKMLPREEEQHVCLHANDSHSVTLTPPPSLVEAKRAKTEVYTGFSHVFLPHSSQEDVYETVMHPLVEDFVEGKSCLLVAMGPTSSGKTHTMFGNFTEPGVIPRALKELLSPDKGNDSRMSRSYFISMFEIYSERGRGEKIFDLFQCGAELSIQQSNIKGLKEVAILSVEEAESLLKQGMEKRTTAATNANSQSSRSQCIINVRSSFTVVDGQRNECKLGEAVLTIVDLAGAEKEKKTGNQGIRFNESNFINNTSMVFGLCLRALLEHQKNPKRALEKHYHNSLVLNVCPGEENYVDTSFVLRQASPYVNIKFTPLSEELPNFPRPKRSSSILSKQLQPRRKKLRLSQENLQLKHGKGLSNSQALVRRTMGDKVNVEDAVAIVKDTNASCSLSPVDAPCEGKEQIHIRDPSPLLFTEEELREKISVKVDEQLKEREERLLAAYETALSNVLKDHQLKVKMMKKNSEGLEVELKKEREHCLELLNEIAMLKECCASLEHENGNLQIALISGNIISNSGSEYENSKPFLIPQDVGCQKIVKAEPVIRSDCNSNTLLVVEGEAEVISNSSQACITVDEEEESCTCLENNETGDVNCDTSLSVNNKSGCLSGDGFKTFQIVAFHEEDTTQPCKGLVENKQNAISKFEETISPLVLEACHNQNNLSHKRDEKIEEENVNTLLVWRNACKSLAEEGQSCVSGANKCLKEDSDNLTEINKNDNADIISANNSLEKFNVDLVEGAEVDQSQNSKMIEICDSVPNAKCRTCNEVNEILKEDLESLSQINNKESIDVVSGTNTFSGFSLVDLEVKGAEIGVFENGKETHEEEKICVTGKENRVLEDDANNSIETNKKDKLDNLSNATTLENFNVDLIEGAEVDRSENSNKIEICNSVTDKELYARNGVKEIVEENVENVPPTNEKENIDNILGANNLAKFSVVPVENADIGSVQNKKESETHQDPNHFSGAKSNLKRGRMLASSLLNRKVDAGIEDINRNAIESFEGKTSSASDTASEDDVGPIGHCLEELLGLSPNEIENGVWKQDVECKRKISDLLERHGGVLDLHLLKKVHSHQRSLCLRYCFALICNKMSCDNQWVSLSENVHPKSRQEFFRAIVKAQTVGKAASHARQGLQQENILKNTNSCFPSSGGLVEVQDAQIDCGSPYHANFPPKALLLNPDCVDSLECKRENICLSSKSPRRKLLPAPSMLVKGIDDRTVEDELPMVFEKSCQKSSSTKIVVATRGRMSLARLLAGSR
ncbi:kinesin-like protein KIN-6 isoform X2 [Cryptomeria japonica]|uniref:kinesin-like protein KIN-6 isoform X2 n=1 Tax=Cryptomeria japonica TaxID=3369 RepID=UPI0027DA9628|nr:kinesin-like protein KIN-6 isoform X2 [Cryptomeria japonica]